MIVSGNNCRGPAHWSCNINLKTSKKLVVIFHNLRGYYSHLIFKELSKFNCSVSVVFRKSNERWCFLYFKKISKSDDKKIMY